jgi:hypothetical protein
MQQRGITPEVVDLILLHGTARPRPGRAEELFLTRDQLYCQKRLLLRDLNALERAGSVSLVVAEDKIITAMHRSGDKPNSHAHR